LNSDFGNLFHSPTLFWGYLW